MNSYLDIAVETAREAGSILLAEYHRPVKISYKGEVDIVTQADRRSEQAIVTRLREHFPSHAIVAEEGGGSESDSPYRWHVDPLDGTTNFAHGYPCFAVSIGLEKDGELIAGVIYQPVSGELFTAAKGEGAYLNQTKIQVSSIKSLETSLLATGFPSIKRAQNPNIHYYWDFTLRSHGVRRDGSAALDLAAVACGRFDGFWEFGLHSWDTAAGVLLVREAGGVVTQFNGQPYRLGDRELLASNGHVQSEMQDVAAGIAERAVSRTPLP
ncbi:MAG TPA: inositol monophosphatase family protein [Candidatus Dormibacteraeota bacterium]|nr:inositol monophosphatase family protein [Candidatus Dormibacteraeota bacterium]